VSGSDAVPGGDEPTGGAPDDPRPEWDDEYVDRVADSLQFNYDLASDERVRGTRFPLYARLEMDTHKQFLHPAISFGHQYSYQHLYVDRRPRVTVEELEALVSLGHELADGIDADEEHRSTEYTFAVVVDDLPPDAESFVAGHSDRTMLKYGYHGHYEVHLVVAVPGERRVVDSGVHVADAFRLWDDGEDASGLLGRLRGLF
jgi:hypothetical protein